MVIGISGMISSGKSTLSKKIVQHYQSAWVLNEYEHDDVIFNTFLKWLYEQKPNLTMALQEYMVENHTTRLEQLFDEFKGNQGDFVKQHIILDRFSLEHFVFAQVNLVAKGKVYLDGFQRFFNQIVKPEDLPDLVIYLDMSFETFEKRLFARNRNVEIKNYGLNKNYFIQLYMVYKEIFIQQVHKYNLNYAIIDTDHLTEKQVFEKAIEIIENFDKNKVRAR
ncbi:deoxyadenosine/deoxycytidine kinase [Mycoplasmopsis mustelae]|uniref:Deoxyadenosine/deoxycytidine kinase n=1 Tax=Mycoplasmopsis mustelae TaxID=171289 RepID=A0A4R7UCW6_9BACT|nr:deoxynucleoside kinase [Mycoplasmopsis mustelae]TDV24287.1 deoxyadenosine/deoxycytidine kinase [Mycoplasmopsis mustelae]